MPISIVAAASLPAQRKNTESCVRFLLSNLIERSYSQSVTIALRSQAHFELPRTQLREKLRRQEYRWVSLCGL
jgi:hypothetical protein